MERLIGDGCPAHDGDELGDIGGEVFGVDGEDVAGCIGMMAVETEGEVADVLPVLVGR